MALETSITVIQSSNGQILEVTDLTGTYNQSTNPTGYGTDRSSGTITANAGNDTFTLNSHGLAQNEIIHFSDVGSLTGFNLDQAYYVIYLSNNDFSLAASLNGPAINFGGTIGTADFNVGYRKADEVDRTYFEVTPASNGSLARSLFLTTPPFIPNGTTEDDTTITAGVTGIGSAGDIISDGIYDVGFVPLWNTSQTLAYATTTSYVVSGVDLSGLYSGHDRLVILGVGGYYYLTINDITFDGSDTTITVSSAPVTGTYGASDWFLGKVGSFTYLAYYNTYVCWQELLSDMNISDFTDCANAPTSKRYITASNLTIAIQSAIATRNVGDYGNAQQIIEYAVKICNRLTANCSSC
jgi:hypothetical protein